MARNKSWGDKTRNADEGVYHRGHGGRRARGVRARKRAIERRTRQQGRKACREGLRDHQEAR